MSLSVDLVCSNDRCLVTDLAQELMMGLHAVAAGEMTLRRLGRLCATKVVAGGNGLATQVAGWSDPAANAKQMTGIAYEARLATSTPPFVGAFVVRQHRPGCRHLRWVPI